MWFDNVGTFMEFGFQHILPQGMDHVLFVAALYLNARNWPSLFMQVTTFTLAHTITLGLASTGVVSAPLEIIEPLIAVSIIVLAIEAIIFPDGMAWRLPVIFAFGLMHGLGFGAAMKVYLESADLSAGLVGITLGVELGHLTVLVATGIAAFVVRLMLQALHKPKLYRPVFVIPAAALIAGTGVFWTLQRTGLLPA